MVERELCTLGTRAMYGAGIGLVSVISLVLLRLLEYALIC